MDFTSTVLSGMIRHESTLGLLLFLLHVHIVVRFLSRLLCGIYRVDGFQLHIGTRKGRSLAREEPHGRNKDHASDEDHGDVVHRDRGDRECQGKAEEDSVQRHPHDAENVAETSKPPAEI